MIIRMNDARKLNISVRQIVTTVFLIHKDCIKDIQRANMHCRDIARARSFYLGLTSADVQKLECFK